MKTSVPIFIMHKGKTATLESWCARLNCRDTVLMKWIDRYGIAAAIERAAFRYRHIRVV
jgi:hypothetical protein